MCQHKNARLLLSCQIAITTPTTISKNLPPSLSLSLSRSSITDIMQHAIPYRNWLINATTTTGGSTAPPPPSTTATSGEEAVITDAKSVRKIVSENAVVVIANKGCCMCHVVKLLLHGHGVNPSIFHVNDQNEAEVIEELSEGGATALQFPAVFVGGEFFGGLEKIMAAHISGELVPRLREARALWL